MVSAQIEEASTTLRESKAGEDMGLAANLPVHFSPRQAGQGAQESLRRLARTPGDDTVASRPNCTISYTSHYVEGSRAQRTREIQTTVATGHLRPLPHHYAPSPTRAKLDAVLNRQRGPPPR